MSKTLVLFFLLASTMSFATIHDDCHQDNSDIGKGNRIFAYGYTGGVIDSMIYKEVNGKRVYTVPEGFTYQTGFEAVCAEIDKHPELWDIPSRDAIIVAVDALWKRRH